MPSPRPTQYLRSQVHPKSIPSSGKPVAQILWVGCCDSGFAETASIDVLPEEIIVHRNPACIVSNDDLSTNSTLEYALRILEVKHIVVCGHYDCRLVNVSSSDNSMGDWLKDVSKLSTDHRNVLEPIQDLVERNRRLVELHVLAQVQSISEKPGVKEAQRNRGLIVHAFVYDGTKEACVELMPSVDEP